MLYSFHAPTDNIRMIKKHKTKVLFCAFLSDEK